MTEANASTPESETGKTDGEAQPKAEAGNAASANGQSDTMKRAEVLADRLALKVGVAATVVTEGLKRFFARVREEAEDVWAEAQHVRKGTKP